MTDEEQAERTIDTGGGAYVEGDASVEGGDVVGRGKVLHAEHVSGPVAVDGGEAVDLRGAQDVVYKPTYEAPPAGAVSLHQLPPPPPDFTGREEELAELAQAITQGGVTISGLRGMGGVGKTALALKLAQQLTPRYPDAQFYLDLQGTSNSPLTPAQAMAHVVRAYHPTARLPESEAELTGLYHSVLHDQRAILLMDNAAGREQVEPLRCPACCVLLVTSRSRFTLPGLKALNLDTLPPDDAQALLLKIAPRIDGHVGEMAELCGYLPLALRLAGSALAERESLSISDYLRRLRDTQTRLGLVDASLSVSYDLLDERLQRLWCVLSVFPGTFDRAAAAAVWQMEEDPAQDALDELVRYSLAEWNLDTRRCRLHDLARLFASAHLDEDRRSLGQMRHWAYYAQVLRAADELYAQGGKSVLNGLTLFDLEWHNIEEGLGWAARHIGQSEVAVQLCRMYVGTGTYCLALRLHPRDRTRWLQASIDASRRIGDRESEGKRLNNLGNAYSDLWQIDKAIDYYTQALAVAREIGDRQTEGNALGNMGSAYRYLGQSDKAIDNYTQALDITQETGDRRGQGIWLSNLGTAYSDLRQNGKSIGYYTQALTIAQEIGDRKGEGSALGHLGTAYYSLDQIREAVNYYIQALTITQEIGDRRGQGDHLGNLGNAYQKLSIVDRAIECYTCALAIAKEIGDRRGESIWINNLGNAYHKQGIVDKAIDCYTEALTIAQEIGDRRGEAGHSWNLGLLYEDTDPAKAVELMSVCVAYEREIGHPDARAHAERVAQIQARIEA